MKSFTDLIHSHLNEHQETVGKLGALAGQIETIASRVIDCLNSGGKVLFFGNGGSAADAQHLAAELVVRYRTNRRAFAGIALTTDTSILTAHSNDFGFDSVFARQIEALANRGDVVIGISTSGNSPSVVQGLKAAKLQDCFAVAFTAESGGQCANLADIAFKAPSSITARAQECHLLAGHIICDIVEKQLSEAEPV